MLWGILFLFFAGFAIYSMGGAIFVMLGFWEDDDGEVRWHPEMLIFTLVVFVIPLWLLINFTCATNPANC